jgi:MFS family permease
MALSLVRLRATFEALDNRPYRWLWLTRLATSGTFQMNNVAQGWLVYHLTRSAFALGWVGAGWSVATLLISPYGGVVTDRVAKRDLMLWTRLGMLLNTLAVGMLIATGAIQVWHLALSTFVNGIFSAFAMPAQQSAVSELVERRVLMNAFSLDALGMGLMGVLAASLAGAAIASAGAQSVYFGMAGMHVLSVYSILRLPRLPPRAGQRGSVWADLVSGARYLRSQSALLTLLVLGMVRVFFVMPANTLLPAFARDNLGMDAAGLGLLQSASGVGGLTASLLACYLGDFRGKGKLLLRASAVLGVCLTLYVTAPWVPVVFLFLAISGGLSNLYMVLSNTLLIGNCDPEYRGRVSSIAMMEWGLMPLGTLPAGAIADRVGVPWVVAVQGLLVSAVFLLAAKFKPEIKRMD